MKWLRKILGLCEHHYEVLAVYSTLYDEKFYVYKCLHCGKLKNHNVL